MIASGEGWKARLIRAICREGQQVGGFGRVVVEFTFSDGVPMEARVVERRPLYRLDRDSVDSRAMVG